MRLWMGQPEAMPLSRVPVWQKGTPQSMQRAACSRSLPCSRWRWNSFQSRMRSRAKRYWGSSRRYSMKPVGLPIIYLSTADNTRDVASVLLKGSHDSLLTAQAGLLHALHGLEDALVVLWHNFEELRHSRLPIRKQPGRQRA